MKEFLFLIIAYISGSIPFSYIIPKMRGIDIRKVGSGNVGGTNVLRALGATYGIISIILDGAKSFVPALVAIKVFGVNSWIPYWVAFLAVLGHDYSIFLKFTGGKGVASTVGSYFAIKPILGWEFLIIWLPLVIITKYVSLSSLIGLLSVGIIGFFYNPKLGTIGILLFLLSAYKHKSNIQRLLKGEERRTDLIKIVKDSFKKEES